MDIKEFKDLTGMTEVTEEYYHSYPEKVYEILPNMEKQVFCHDWAKHSGSTIIKELFWQLSVTKANLDIANETNERAADLLIKMAKEMKQEDCKKMAIEMIGKTMYIKKVLSLGYDLNKDERDTVITWITYAERAANNEI